MKSLDSINSQLSTFWEQRTSRERLLVVGAVIVLSTMIIYSFVLGPTVKAFTEQATEMRQITNAYKVAPDILGRYANLVSRRNAIEQTYQNADIKTNPLTHLEHLLRDVAKVAPGAYRVDPRDGSQIGGKFRHKIFIVTFPVTNLSHLAEFLKELTTGPQPMMISQIYLDKRVSQESLEVKLEVSGFEVIQGQ